MKNLILGIFILISINLRAEAPTCLCSALDDVLPYNSTFMYGLSGPNLNATLSFDSPCVDNFSVTFNWDYGDGNTYSYTTSQPGGGNITNPSSNINHTYTSPGNYTVCLTVIFQGFEYCVKEFCEDIVVASGDPCDFDPSFEAIFNPSTCSWFFELDSWASIPFGVTVLDVNWDFGDGNTRSGNSVVHNYSATGGYTVTMEVWTTDGNECCVQSVSIDMGVSDICDPCSIMGSAGTNVVNREGVYTFSEINLSKLYDYNFAYYWDFGDGNFAVGQTVDHIYENPEFSPSSASLSIYYYNPENGECCKKQIFDLPYIPLMGEDQFELEQSETHKSNIRSEVILNENMDQKLTISPNPSSDRFELRLSNRAINQVSVFDQTGKRVFSDKNTVSTDTYHLDLTGVKTGLYIILINEDDLQHRVFGKLMIAPQ